MHVHAVGWQKEGAYFITLAYPMSVIVLPATEKIKEGQIDGCVGRPSVEQKTKDKCLN
jgi:hypothetical protein